jgi:hypothetical protein
MTCGDGSAATTENLDAAFLTDATSRSTVIRRLRVAMSWRAAAADLLAGALVRVALSLPSG